MELNPNPTLKEARHFLMTTAHKIPYIAGKGFDPIMQNYKHKCIKIVEEEKMRILGKEGRVDLKVLPKQFKRY